MAYRELPSVYKIVAFTEAKQFGDEARIAEETGFSASHVNIFNLRFPLTSSMFAHSKKTK